MTKPNRKDVLKFPIKMASGEQLRH